MLTTICAVCGKELSPARKKMRASTCNRCIKAKRIEKEKSDEFLKGTFKKVWVAELFKGFIKYLEDMEITCDTMVILTRKKRKLLSIADDELVDKKDINYEWLHKSMVKMQEKHLSRSIINFLIKEGNLKIDYEKPYQERVKSIIKQTPENYRRLLEIFYQERMKFRERQIYLNARKPLSMSTIVSNMQDISRFIKFLNEYKLHINSWTTIQQEDVNDYLLTLTPNHRELIRNRLMFLFRLAFRKKIITHIPLVDMQYREMPAVEEPLQLADQKKIALLLKKNKYTHPLECLITSLCFYHGLSTKQVQSIELKHINLRTKLIYINDRPPLYLLEDDLIFMEEYAKLRVELKNIQDKRFLFVSASKADMYVDKPVSAKFIRDKVKALTGITPKTLRITCFSSLCNELGPQILVEGFGLSLTQASRYGRFSDYLIEESIKEQRDALHL